MYNGSYLLIENTPKIRKYILLGKNYFKMAGGDAPTAEYSHDGESRTTASTDGVETEQAKTAIYWTGSNILGGLLETGQRMAEFLGNRQPQNGCRLEQKKIQKVLGKQIPEPKTWQTAP